MLGLLFHLEDNTAFNGKAMVVTQWRNLKEAFGFDRLIKVDLTTSGNHDSAYCDQFTSLEAAQASYANATWVYGVKPDLKGIPLGEFKHPEAANLIYAFGPDYAPFSPEGVKVTVPILGDVGELYAHTAAALILHDRYTR